MIYFSKFISFRRINLINKIIFIFYHIGSPKPDFLSPVANLSAITFPRIPECPGTFSIFAR